MSNNYALKVDPTFSGTAETETLTVSKDLTVTGRVFSKTVAISANSTEVATTAAVNAAIAAISIPAATDTSSLAPKKDPTFSGTVTLPTVNANGIINLSENQGIRYTNLDRSPHPYISLYPNSNGQIYFDYSPILNIRYAGYTGNLLTATINTITLDASSNAEFYGAIKISGYTFLGASLSEQKYYLVAGTTWTGTSWVSLTGQPYTLTGNNNKYSIWCSNSNGRVLIASEIDVYSDKRIKKNIESIDIKNALESVRKVSSVTYNHIEKDDTTEIGFIAQEI